jgi:pimeloyl-ACP methyl ester carboxylesterase
MRILICFFVLLFSDLLEAQQAPYDIFPAAQPPYYRVRYEPSTVPGELIFGVNYTIWIPPNVKVVRGIIVHQHGCGEGSCKSGLTGAFDLHWQALAKKHDCALLAASYEQPEKADCQMWCDPRNGSDRAFQKCLVDLGVQAGHPELSKAPWALWGHSGGGHWAGGMVLLHPERVAAAWLRSGVPLLKPNPERPTIKTHVVPDAALTVPLMCNMGTKEGVTVKEGRFAGVWPSNEIFFTEIRSKGGLICVAVDPLTAHECGNQRYLSIPWFDACLAARLPNAPGEPLKSISNENSWLAPLYLNDSNIVAPVPIEKFKAAKEKSVWLINERMATAWSEFVKDTAVTDTTPPPSPTELKIVGNELTWRAESDLESGISHFIIERDGVFLAKVPEKSTNPYGRPIFQNLQYSDTPSQPLVAMQYIDTKAELGKTYQYRVRSVNTVGLQSQE